MAFTLNKLASDTSNQSVKRRDAVRVRLTDIVIVDGFNKRTSDDELREHVAAIAGAISIGLPIPPLEVWVNPETGTVELVDGHCRYDGYMLYQEGAPDFDGFISVVEFVGTSAQRKARIVTSNNQLKLKPVELGRVYLDLRDNEDLTRQQIAYEVGKSVAHVDQMILLASASSDVIAAVESGEISATEAVKLARDHGDDSSAELERRKVAAKEIGNAKVTAKAVEPKKSPARPRVDLVVSNAVVLVNGLSEMAKQDCERPEKTNILVDSHALADLIMAVREMQQAGKPLDADKQTELEV